MTSGYIIHTVVVEYAFFFLIQDLLTKSNLKYLGMEKLDDLNVRKLDHSLFL